MADTKLLEVKKKVYTKPMLSEVRLVAEEAVLGLCKNNNGVQNTCQGDQNCLMTPRS
jgi:hypothetical protein